MGPHPDFAASDFPREAELPSFRLTPLAPAHVKEDYEAVMSSASVLKGIFGPDWPEGLTLEADLTDLHWHEREFTACRSFSWIVRDPGGSYLGCAYLSPAIGGRGRAEASVWVRDIEGRDATGERLVSEFDEWLQAYLPPGIALTWNTSP